MPVGGLSRPGQSSTAKSVGFELDATIKITLNRHTNTTLGYSRLFPGEFIRQSGPVKHVNFACMIWQFTM